MAEGPEPCAGALGRSVGTPSPLRAARVAHVRRPIAPGDQRAQVWQRYVRPNKPRSALPWASALAGRAGELDVIEVHSNAVDSW